MEFALVLTNFPADGDADRFAQRLVDERLAACVRELHPYEVPEFLVLTIEVGSPAYLSWLGDSVI